MTKRLYRSRTDRLLAGVCGGLAKYFNIDPAIVRIITVVIGIILPPATLFAYIIMAVIVPLEESGASGTS